MIHDCNAGRCSVPYYAPIEGDEKRFDYEGHYTRYYTCADGLQARGKFEHGVAPWATIPRRLRACSMKRARLLLEGQHAYDLAAQMIGRAANATDREGRGLLLLGAVGCGKSGLATAAALELRALGIPTIWWDYQMLISAVRREWGTEADGRLILSMQRAPYLILDDLGDPFRERGEYAESESKRQTIYEIVTHRLNACRPTILTANYGSLEELADQFDPRLADRIGEACEVVTINGPSLRAAPAEALTDDQYKEVHAILEGKQ